MHSKTTLGFSRFGIHERKGTAINGAPGIAAELNRVVVTVVVDFLIAGAALATGRDEKITDSIIATVALFLN